MTITIIASVLVGGLAYAVGNRTRAFIHVRAFRKNLHEFTKDNKKTVEALSETLTKFGGFSNDEIAHYTELLENVSNSSILSNMSTIRGMLGMTGSSLSRDELKRFFSALEYIFYCHERTLTVQAQSSMAKRGEII